MKKTINGKSVSEITKEEALNFCYTNKDKYIRGFTSVDEGIRQFDCLIAILEDSTIEPHELPEYGMSDQEL